MPDSLLYMGWRYEKRSERISEESERGAATAAAASASAAAIAAAVAAAVVAAAVTAGQIEDGENENEDPDVVFIENIAKAVHGKFLL